MDSRGPRTRRHGSTRHSSRPVVNQVMVVLAAAAFLGLFAYLLSPSGPVGPLRRTPPLSLLTHAMQMSHPSRGIPPNTGHTHNHITQATRTIKPQPWYPSKHRPHALSHPAVVCLQTLTQVAAVHTCVSPVSTRDPALTSGTGMRSVAFLRGCSLSPVQSITDTIAVPWYRR